MKIRTDFVTNSSSSSFSVIVRVKGKNGREFSFREDPYQKLDSGECSFGGDVGSLLVKNSLKEIREIKDEKGFFLCFVGEEGRNARIENVHVGDVLSLVKIPVPAYAKDEYYEFSYTMDVRSREGSVGLLPHKALRKIAYFSDLDSLELKAIVSSVTPLSQRRGNAKYSLLSVSFDAEEKDAEQKLIFKNVSDLAQFLMNSVYEDQDYWYWEEEEFEEDEDEYDDEEEESKDKYEFDSEDDDEDKSFSGKLLDSLKKIIRSFHRSGSTCDEASESSYEKYLNTTYDDYLKEIEEEKTRFIRKVTSNFKSIEDIASIIVEREYFAWGEFADLIPDNDKQLRELAERVHSGDRSAIGEMKDYINKSVGVDRAGEHFGIGYEDFRYKWSGNTEDLRRLADRLCSGYGPEFSRGVEHDEINLETGTVESYAEYELC